MLQLNLNYPLRNYSFWEILWFYLKSIHQKKMLQNKISLFGLHLAALVTGCDPKSVCGISPVPCFFLIPFTRYSLVQCWTPTSHLLHMNLPTTPERFFCAHITSAPLHHGPLLLHNWSALPQRPKCANHSEVRGFQQGRELDVKEDLGSKGALQRNSFSFIRIML